MRYLLALTLLMTSAQAQPVDEELFDQMVKAIAKVSAPLETHQDLLTIFAGVKREAGLREAKRKQEETKRKQEEKK